MIIITGAAGLIGSAIVRELNQRGETDLLLVDHLGTTDKWMNLRSLSFKHYMEKEEFLEALLLNPDTSEGDFRQARAIIHLGACSATTEMDASYLINNNYEYSRLLADFSIKHGIRMVFASSAATYGEGEQGYEDDQSKLGTLRPLNPYGYSKHVFDLWLEKRGFPAELAGIKYFNVYGPNEYHKGNMMSLVLKAYRQVIQEGEIKLFKSYRPEYKDGEQKRDFLYVKDAAKMTVYLALDNTGVSGLFNAGCGEANTWVELASSIFAALGKEPNIKFVDMPEELKGRYQYYTCAPMDKLKQAGFTHSVMPLQEAVADYVQNYLAKGELRA